jgi:SMI1 / KNR4 family (SUKH-1)
MGLGASDQELAAAEAVLGLFLPSDLRQALHSRNGSEQWHGDIFLMMYGTPALIEVNQETDRFPGFLVFGSDGSREMIGYDLRCSPPPVVMLDVTAEDWSEALLQADSLPDFLERLERGEGLRWDHPYAAGQT